MDKYKYPNLIFDSSVAKMVYPQEFCIEPCDIFFTHGNGIISKIIRFGERHPGDWISLVNHTGIVVEQGTIGSADIIEALVKVRKHTLWSQYHDRSDKVAIFRPLNLSNEHKSIIVNKALDYEGRTYGYLKIGTHTLDYFTGGRYIFRRLTNSDRYPICSWVVAQSYSKVGLTFGCSPGQANPDDIWDYCTGHPEKYQKVFDLQNI
jgi:hypothetical protein